MAYGVGLDGNTGAEGLTPLYNTSDYIPVNTSTYYTVRTFVYTSAANYRIYMYDSAKAFIRRNIMRINSSPEGGYQFVTDSDCAYIRLTFESSSNTAGTQDEKTCVLLEKKTEITSYIPYYTAYDRVARLLKLDIPSDTVLPNNTDLNAIPDNSAWMVNSTYTYPNFPDMPNSGGWIFALLFNKTGKLQIYIPSRESLAGIYIRNNIDATTWNDWRNIASGEKNTYNTTYELNHYTNTFTASVSPSITTDSNNYLATTGTTADVKASIEAMLSASGVCRLGPGDFYVSGIDMPMDSMLCGSGPKTRLILLGSHTDEGYAIHLNHRCSVQDMSILGSVTDRAYADVSPVLAERHGILFEAEAYDGTDVDSSSFIEKCNLENLWIKNFTGGGITAYNTGYGVQSCMNVANVFIWYCNAGVNVSFFSEFHRFTNVHTWCCYYGVINNGGNNTFSCCCFSRNHIGMLMDNSTGTKRNNSHGIVSSCVFVHADAEPFDNDGIGIKIIGMHNGHIFSDCQIGSDIVIDDCSGVRFSNINAEAGADITVTKGASGGLIMFSGMIVVSPASFSLSVEAGYSQCKFSNCWDVNGNEIGV